MSETKMVSAAERRVIDWAKEQARQAADKALQDMFKTRQGEIKLMMPRASIKTTIGAENAVQWLIDYSPSDLVNSL